MMKSFCAAMSLLAVAACSENDDLNPGSDPSGNGNANAPLTTVNFELSADAASSGTLTKALPAPVYEKEGFRILAFKKDDTGNTGNYLYKQDVPMDSLEYNAGANTLSGQVQLPIGTYKFISMYGVPESTVMTMPSLSNAVLAGNLVMTHVSNAVLPSVFLDVNALASVPSYDLGLVSPGNNRTVSSKVNRAVGRVDLLFVRTDADHNPVAGADVFGPAGVKSIAMNFSQVKNNMDLTGHVTGGSMSHRYDIGFPTPALTMGTGTSMKLGEPDYTAYDLVAGDDIITGSAHISGAYLIPESDGTATAGLSMVITPNSGTARTITIVDPIPLKRNYVTLIKVYVRGDNVFTTGVDFDVVIDPTWEGSLNAEVEVN